ncbi:hypothetical protein PsorP6_012613 [Peronosclerospora sorghi]|uniref:Uncharacterized protein n=1 Tax=Peronosclerospora sorghi TaxID=230839 RepID=A0ACC0WIC3_9STRA|nr:hypothetical protein PsorP6_012613 [Peronosclerospora sorghi]
MKLDLNKSHYQMLAGVCIEYCALIGRMDLLFGEIYTRFKDANKLEVLIELLEPYILAEKLRNLSPVAMEEFVSFVVLMNSGGTNRNTTSKVSIAEPAGLSSREKDKEATLRRSRRRRSFGYKFFLYISYALSGRTFPKHEEISPLKIGKVRSQICYHLFERSVPGSSNPRPYPRLETLIDLDARGLFIIMGRMSDTPSVEFEGDQKRGMGPPTSRYDSAQNAEMTKCPSFIFGPKSPFGTVEHAQFFMFEALLLSSGSIKPQKYAVARDEAIGNAGSAGGASMMHSLMNFLDLGPTSLLLKDSLAVTVETSQEEGFDKAGREAMLIHLLTKLNKTTYNHEASVIKEKMNPAAVLLYKDMGDISRAIASYLADEDHEYQMNAFSYIRTETDKAVDGEKWKCAIVVMEMSLPSVVGNLSKKLFLIMRQHS